MPPWERRGSGGDKPSKGNVKRHCDGASKSGLFSGSVTGGFTNTAMDAARVEEDWPPSGAKPLSNPSSRGYNASSKPSAMDVAGDDDSEGCAVCRVQCVQCV